MKILLLYLPKNPDDTKDYEHIIQPLGLAQISAYLKLKNWDVTLMDAQAHKMSRQEIEAYIDTIKPDVIGFSTMTYNLPIVASFLSEIRKKYPKIKIVLGGSHVSVEAESTLTYFPEVDFVVIGEGEYTLDELFHAIKENSGFDKIKGLGWRKEGQIILNERREVINDLDTLPMPDWDSLPMEKYWDAYTTRYNYVRLFASRGCPFNCTFCGAPNVMGRKIRKRSPEKIIEELTYLAENHNVREFIFGDSTFNIDNDWVAKICHGIINMKYKLRWRCCVRASLVDKETTLLMKKAGCVAVIMGIESANNQMLKSMRKGQTVDDIIRASKILRSVKMPSHHSYILGMPGDTVESIQKSIDFAKEYSVDNNAIFMATPFPGTEFYEQAKREGFINFDDWSKLSCYDISYVPQGMTREELVSCYKKAVREYYFRPSYLLRQLTKRHSWINFKINLRFAFRVLQRMFKIH